MLNLFQHPGEILKRVQDDKQKLRLCLNITENLAVVCLELLVKPLVKLQPHLKIKKFRPHKPN